jgi:hypothetical protein
MARQRVRGVGHGPRLRPAARPVDTYYRPDRPAAPTPPPQTNGWLQIAGALAGVEPSLNQYFDNEAKKEKERQEYEARIKVISTPFTEIEKMRQSGTLPKTGDIHHDNAMSALVGGKGADAFQYDLWQRLNGVSTSGEGEDPNHFDWNSGMSYDDWVAQEFANRIETYTTPEARQAFTDRWTALEPNLRKHWQAKQVDQQKEEASDGIYMAIDQVVSKGIQDGVPPEQIVENLRKAKPEVVARLGGDNSQYDDVLLTYADHLADSEDKGGYYPFLKQLLTTKRGDLPAISEKGSSAGTVDKILDKASRNHIDVLRKGNSDVRVYMKDKAQNGQLDKREYKALKEAHPDIFTDSEWESLQLVNSNAQARAKEKIAKLEAKTEAKRRSAESEQKRLEYLNEAAEQGVLSNQNLTETLTDNGEVKQHDLNSNVKDWADHYINEVSPRLAKERGETQEQRFHREAQVFSRNGVAHPVWKRVIQNGHAAINTVDLANGEIPQIVKQATDIYTGLRTNYRSYLNTMMTQDQADAYDVYATARDVLGEDGNTSALTLMKNFMADPASFRSRINQTTRSQLKTKIKGKIEQIPGANLYMEDVERSAEILVAAGVADPETAINTAMERVEGTFSQINGRWVKTASPKLKMVPNQLKAEGYEARSFEDVATIYLTHIVEPMVGDEGLSLRETDRAGVFQLVDASGMPVWHMEGGTKLPHGGYLTLEQMVGYEKGRQAAIRAKRLRDAQDEAEKAGDPWFENDYISIGPFTPTKGDYERYEDKKRKRKSEKDQERLLPPPPPGFEKDQERIQ